MKAAAVLGRVLKRGRSAEEFVGWGRVPERRRHGREARVGRVRAERSEHRAPLLVVADGNRDPSLIAVFIGASISTMRGIAIRFIAARTKHAPAGKVIDKRRREILHRGLVL